MGNNAALGIRSNSRWRLTEEAYATLTAAIASGELQPGERLYETTLSARFGMSRTPVREALQRLVNERLAEETADGVRVASLSIDDVRAVQQASRALQSLAARLATSAAAESDLAALEDLMRRVEACATAHDSEGWVAAGIEMHRRIFQMSGNPWVSRLLLQMECLMTRVRHVMLRRPGWLEQATRDYRVIVDAIKSRDGNVAEHTMHDHLMAAEKVLIETLEAVVPPRSGDHA